VLAGSTPPPGKDVVSNGQKKLRPPPVSGR
jgi:hypothetical protein